MPDIFNYSDYRIFLKDWFEEKKKKNPSFSLRVLSKRSKPIPASTFWMVMRGERNLTPVSLKPFLALLNLSERESLYFQALVMFNQAKGWSFKQRQLERIVEMRLALNLSDIRKLKSSVEFHLYSTWYTIPIHILIEDGEFRDEPVWISKKLGADVT